MSKYTEYKKLDLSTLGKEVLTYWQEHKVFEKSLENRAGHTPWVFYEGPPSANGLPGIHHVISRAIKDIFLPLPHPEGISGRAKGRLGHPWIASVDRRGKNAGHHQGRHREKHFN